MVGRRGNGEGTVYQLADGRWRFQATIAGRRCGGYAKTRKEAQTKLRGLHGEADRGLLPPTEKVTLEQYLIRWLADEVKHTRRWRTHDSYSDAARLYLLPTLGRVKLTQLQPAHVQQVYGELIERGLAPRTVGIAHSTLHAALEQAVAWNLVPRNVAGVVKPPRVKRQEVQALTAEQARQLRETARHTRWHALIAIALATGMRQGELLGLKWADLDLDSGVVYVRRQLGVDKVLAEQKTDKNRRSIDLDPTTVATLREHKRQQNEERLLQGSQWEANDLVCCTHRGRPLGHRNVVREFKRLLVKAGLPDVKFHALRHTNATLLLLQGIHPKIVQERLGHSSISMTLDIYSHVLPRMGREAATRLEALFA